jgi:uncharacterized SAM-binding protein YcdF (DUF218 family)
VIKSNQSQQPATCNKQPVSRKWLRRLAIFFLLFAAFLLAREAILLGVGKFLIVRDELQPAHLIHVLGGDVERIDYGIELHKQGYGKILFTGGRVELPLVNTTYSRLAREYAESKGVRAEDILPDESTATSTFEEVLELQKILRHDASLQSIIIVSSPYHLRRARWIFKKGLDKRVTLQFAPVPFEKSRQKQRWWTEELSLQAVVNEYLKMPFYILKY